MREKGGDVSLRVFANDKWLFTGQQGVVFTVLCGLILCILLVHSLLWMQVGDDSLQLQPTKQCKNSENNSINVCHHQHLSERRATVVHVGLIHEM